METCLQAAVRVHEVWISACPLLSPRHRWTSISHRARAAPGGTVDICEQETVPLLPSLVSSSEPFPQSRRQEGQREPRAPTPMMACRGQSGRAHVLCRLPAVSWTNVGTSGCLTRPKRWGDWLKEPSGFRQAAFWIFMYCSATGTPKLSNVSHGLVSSAALWVGRALGQPPVGLSCSCSQAARTGLTWRLEVAFLSPPWHCRAHPQFLSSPVACTSSGWLEA